LKSETLSTIARRSPSSWLALALAFSVPAARTVQLRTAQIRRARGFAERRAPGIGFRDSADESSCETVKPQSFPSPDAALQALVFPSI